MIHFDYAKAIRQAKEIEKCADDLEKIATGDMNALQASLANSWTGEASHLFIGNCDELRSELSAEATQLRSVAARIRQVSETIRRAEEEAKRAAAQRNG